MEQKDIDIYEILKDMPDGTSLYTPMVGKVVFTYPSSNGIIRTEKDSGIIASIRTADGGREEK